ncbi:MAG: hypothetical protein ACRCX2_18005 [Paraclostridium sp.]
MKPIRGIVELLRIEKGAQYNLENKIKIKGEAHTVVVVLTNGDMLTLVRDFHVAPWDMDEFMVEYYSANSGVHSSLHHNSKVVLDIMNQINVGIKKGVHKKSDILKAVIDVAEYGFVVGELEVGKFTKITTVCPNMVYIQDLEDAVNNVIVQVISRIEEETMRYIESQIKDDSILVIEVLDSDVEFTFENMRNYRQYI